MKTSVPVIWSVPPHMSNTVDKECNVKSDTEAEVEQHPERLPQRFVPVVPWHPDWQCNHQQREQWNV